MRAQSGSLTRAFPLPSEQRPEERRDQIRATTRTICAPSGRLKEIFDLHTCGSRYQRFATSYSEQLTRRRENDSRTERAVGAREAGGVGGGACWRRNAGRREVLTALVRRPDHACRLRRRAAAEAAAELDRIRSLLVSWRGALVVERYYNGARATSPANIKSASKSIISALVGIAIDRGAIDGVRQPIARLLSDR